VPANRRGGQGRPPYERFVSSEGGPHERVNERFAATTHPQGERLTAAHALRVMPDRKNILAFPYFTNQLLVKYRKYRPIFSSTS
jgi:hypothetical protein